jgi:tetratricopeptide (TPR) repeat protein
MLLVLENAYAKPPDVKLITSPLNIHTIDIGTERDTITIIARVDREGVQFIWDIDGPGKIEEDSPPRKIFYTPPDQINTTSAEVTIIVTATDDRGETASNSITFMLRTSTPVPTPTLSPSPTPLLEEIAQLLEAADEYFRDTIYTKPKDKNAFRLYKEVLRIDPANRHAREKIRKIIADYKNWGDRAYKQKDYERAQKDYQGYQLVARYMVDQLKEQSLEPEFQEVQIRLDELAIIVVTPPPTVVTPSPTPTATPIPTVTPSPTPTATPTPTPTPTVMPTPSDVVEQLLKKCDDLFQRQQFTTPEDNNAFDCYKTVLEKKPANLHAREGIYEIAKIYKNWGDKAYQQKNCDKAKTYYERYGYVAEYIVTSFADKQIKQESQDIQKRVQECALTPTQTPSVASWTPSCPPTTKGLEELLQQSLPTFLGKYKTLKDQEQQGAKVNNQIIIAIEDIVCDLIAIENILEENYKISPDDEILIRIQKIKKTRDTYEQELLDRLTTDRP